MQQRRDARAIHGDGSSTGALCPSLTPSGPAARLEIRKDFGASLPRDPGPLFSGGQGSSDEDVRDVGEALVWAGGWTLLVGAVLGALSVGACWWAS